MERLAAQGQQAAEKQWVELVSKSAEHKSMYVAARAQLEQQTQSTAVQRWKLGAEKAAQENEILKQQRKAAEARVLLRGKK